MAVEPHSVAQFYATPQGATVQHLVRERLHALWPELAGQAVLGLGYAGPYLPLWQGTARSCIAANPALGGGFGPVCSGHRSACTVQEDALPFADLSMDRVLLVHGLENADNARRLLREVWRVLKDDGRLLVVAPNRVGMWAQSERTPFGQGQPYSPGQVGRLLAASLFSVERRESALYLPPLRHPVVLRSAALFERAGRTLVPRFAGLTLAEAVKDTYAAIPLKAVSRRRYVLAEAA